MVGHVIFRRISKGIYVPRTCLSVRLFDVFSRVFVRSHENDVVTEEVNSEVEVIHE